MSGVIWATQRVYTKTLLKLSAALSAALIASCTVRIFQIATARISESKPADVQPLERGNESDG